MRSSIMLTIFMAIWKRKFSKVISSKVTASLFYNDVFRVELPEGHKFPMEKYYLVRVALLDFYKSRHDIKFLVSPMATKEELESTHCQNYIGRFLSGNLNPLENRRIGFPWSISGVQRSTSSVGGTVAAMRAVCDHQCMVAGHLAGGTHHAFYDYGEGFCVFSDIAVAANLALKEYNSIKKVLIVDLDVHQGNGNAVLFQNNPDVFTFSMHCKENYFSNREYSNLDVELDAGTSDHQYLELLEKWIPKLLEEVQPDLVFYQAGVDVHEDDRLGRLKLSTSGIARRNKIVYNYIKAFGSKLVVTMGGGYPRNLNIASKEFQNILQAHKEVYTNCIEVYES